MQGICGITCEIPMMATATTLLGGRVIFFCGYGRDNPRGVELAAGLVLPCAAENRSVDERAC